ncbi:type III-A CRISPR-associated protein Csm2 [uncultured Dubosiella sp.]|uniref:type III-A CRISPR-associated protein Csm2 n=1 Tax=uncultured Dubosiella sp. TaxID=1937011 RepID=UPI0027317CF2|nr:type III-A CRISPR-associated protein Csm2 [uncultured Dubosiella sp.]
MQQSYNQNRRNKNNNHSRYNANNNQPQEWRELKKPDRPLSEYYANKEELLLPNQYAYQVANKFEGITTHQLRKILSQTKIARTETEAGHFSEARTKLFSLVPLAAYNVGRAKEGRDRQKMENLYSFLVANLKPETLKAEKDIYVFDELFTSIIAYHKFLERK